MLKKHTLSNGIDVTLTLESVEFKPSYLLEWAF